MGRRQFSVFIVSNWEPIVYSFCSSFHNLIYFSFTLARTLVVHCHHLFPSVCVHKKKFNLAQNVFNGLKLNWKWFNSFIIYKTENSDTNVHWTWSSRISSNGMIMLTIIKVIKTVVFVCLLKYIEWLRQDSDFYWYNFVIVLLTLKMTHK